MVRYDPYTDSFIDNPTKEITATINLDAIPKDIIQINEVVEVSDESIEKIADAVVRKLTDRKTEPQSDCGDFADRLAYERGVKHAWEVAQKVFDSTVTFYEAEDVAKQIDKDINVRSKDEPQTCEECEHWSDTEDGCADRHGCKTEPQTSKIIEAYAKGFEDGADAVNAMPSTECIMCKHFKHRPNCGLECEYDTFEECNYEPKDEPQTEHERASEQREHDLLYEPTYDIDDGSM